MSNSLVSSHSANLIYNTVVVNIQNERAPLLSLCGGGVCVLRRVMRQSGGEGEAECDGESLLSGFPLPSSAKNSCVVLPSNCRYVNLLSLLSLFSWIFSVQNGTWLHGLSASGSPLLSWFKYRYCEYPNDRLSVWIFKLRKDNLQSFSPLLL